MGRRVTHSIRPVNYMDVSVCAAFARKMTAPTVLMGANMSGVPLIDQSALCRYWYEYQAHGLIWQLALQYDKKVTYADARIR